MTSGGATTLLTPVHETLAVGYEGSHETRETDGGSSKAGDQDDDKAKEEDWTRQRQDPQTPVSEAIAVALECQHKTKEMAGGSEELEIEVDDNSEACIRCGMTTTKGGESDTEVGTTTSEGRKMKHALRPLEGQETSMHPKQPERVTDDCGRVKPLRCKYGKKDGVARSRINEMSRARLA